MVGFGYVTYGYLSREMVMWAVWIEELRVGVVFIRVRKKSKVKGTQVCLVRQQLRLRCLIDPKQRGRTDSLVKLSLARRLTLLLPLWFHAIDFFSIHFLLDYSLACM